MGALVCSSLHFDFGSDHHGLWTEDWTENWTALWTERWAQYWTDKWTEHWTEVAPVMDRVATGQGNTARRRRRFRSDEDVARIAREWASGWVSGAAIGRWLKLHVGMMDRMVRDEGWSWQDLAEAMNRAGIRYRTERPWSADLLSDKAARARRELRAASSVTKDVEPSLQTPAQAEDAARPLQPQMPPPPVFDPDEDTRPIEREPEFKIATLRGWSRPSRPALPPQESPPSERAASPPANAPDVDVKAVLAEFLARPRYGAIPMPQPFEPEDD